MTRLEALLERIPSKTVLVVGDVILDEYIIGAATRMSREAPVPVLELESRRYIAGGAANPAANIVSLGASALLAGVVGEDEAGQRLRRILRERDIEASGIFACRDRPTTVKTRILAQMGLRFPQQVTRIDTLSRRAIGQETEARIAAHVRERGPRLDALLLSHYHGGLLTSALVSRLRRFAAERGLLLTADAQGRFEIFRGVDVIKCNADEARRWLNRELATDADFAEAARQLGESLEIKRATIITRGNHGATVSAGGPATHCPAPLVSDVYDTVGAGDTAIALITLAMAAGAEASDAMRLANLASGIVVRHLGNYAPTLEELRSALGEAL